MGLIIRRFSLVMVFFLSVVGLYAQQDYYIVDGEATFGVKIYDKGDIVNSKQCIVKQSKKKNIEFSPNDIDEYGFKNGKVYFSKIIHISNKTEKVFLQRLVVGKTTLYYYKDKENKLFFLENDSLSLVQLPPISSNNISFKSALQTYARSCSDVAKSAKLVSYKKKPVTRFIENFNDCTNRPLPFFKYGLLAGYELNKTYLSLNSNDEDLKAFDYKYHGGFIIGAFIDNPLIGNDISLHLEGYFSQNNFSYATSNLDLLVNTTSLSFPILFRYSYPSFKKHFFVNAGGVFTYNIKNENALYQSNKVKQRIYLSQKYKNSLISETQIGFSIGGGMQIRIDYKRSLFVELRYSNLFNFEYSQDMLNNSIFHLMTSVNL